MKLNLNIEEKELKNIVNDKLLKENFKLKIALLSMVYQYCCCDEITNESINENLKIMGKDYKKETKYYEHCFMQAGESAWNALGFDEDFVSNETIWGLLEKIEKDYYKMC